MLEWQSDTVERCLVRFPLGAVPKLQTNEYRPAGRYPVVDQGQSLVAGWTDDASGLIAHDLPVVVFGDHTRVMKFIDFPFVRGADGTQILKPKPGIVPLFFYYALRAIDLPSRGYNRHFNALREKEIPLPPQQEQSDIARTLNLVEEVLSLQDKELQTSILCKRTAMKALFTSGLRHELLKETEIGPVPENWTLRPLDDAATIYSSTRLSYSELLARGKEDEENNWLSVLGIKVLDLAKCEAEVPLSEADLSARISKKEAAHRCIPPGAIVFPKNGAAVATNKKRLVTQYCVLDPNVMALHSKAGLEQSYLYQWLQHFDLKSIVKPGPVPNFGKGDIAAVLVPMPPSLEEQLEIVAILDELDRKIDLHRRKRMVLDELFTALLHQLVTGEVRVVDLDLSAVRQRSFAGAAA
jgi:type I restriction enzyme S subunit